MSLSARLLLAHIVFLVSGASALGCQVLWSRMLGLGLGQEMPAVLAVVGAFFGGFALGARGSDALLRRWPGCPGRWYAALELGIGVWVLLSPWVLAMTNHQAPRLLGVEPGPLRHGLVAFGVPLLILLPATAAMGGTLALMEAFTRDRAGDRRVVGPLYAANTLGAALGGLAVLALAERLGFRNTLGVTGLLHLGCAAAASWLSRTAPDRAPTAGPTRPLPGSVPGDARVNLSAWRWRLALFGTGWLGIGLEVLGVRMLKLVLEDTVYTLARVLAVYLGGTALGAAALKWAARRWPVAGRADVLLVGLALSCAGFGWSLGTAPAVHARMQAAWGGTLAAISGAEVAVAVWVFLLPCVLMGATFAGLAQGAHEAGFGLGRALAWNTLGGAVAPVVIGAALFPAVGARWTVVVLATGYLGLALGLSGSRWVVWSALPLAVALVTAPDLRLAHLPSGERLRVWREGISDSVAVVETAEGHRTLRVNNRYTMGGTGAWAAQRRQAHVPLLLHPAPRRVLFLGSGTGITAAGAAAHPGLEADSVELVPEVVAVMPEFAPANAVPPGRLRQFTADARRFVRATPHRYDVIVADLFHPARDGAGALYTREHFAAIRERLAPGGLFCQWVPLYQTDARTFRCILGTFRAVFGDCQLWLLRLNLDTPVAGLVGRVPDPEAAAAPTLTNLDGWLDRRAGAGPLREELRALGLHSDEHLAALLLTLRPERLPSGPVATEDRPVVAFTGPRARTMPNRRPDTTLFWLLEQVRAATGDAADGTRRLERLLAARDRYLEGLRQEQLGDRAAAREAFVESAGLSPDFTTAYAHVLTLAVHLSADNPAEARRLLERLTTVRPEVPVARELIKRLLDREPAAP